MVLGLEVADGMVSLKNNIQKQLGKRFNSVYMASDFYLKFGPVGTQRYNECTQTSVNFLCYSPMKISPFLPS